VITGEDGKNHMFVARWPESGPKGHWESLGKAKGKTG